MERGRHRWQLLLSLGGEVDREVGVEDEHDGGEREVSGPVPGEHSMTEPGAAVGAAWTF